MFYACISLQNMQKCIAIHFCFPFIEGNACFDTSLKISLRRRVIVAATYFLVRLNIILASTPELPY
jgi:hypothetical protein